ncbi:hypothetical protein DN730_08125 [Marinomonas piezotolerans]|uniref:Uncharacterized protein n=1 Tax=Marinomonas piezotolerans TaxID=2213058 RepID=A0A370U9B9_9GAMM|nr:DUF6682 family protein [Marinomonas piezotolerans]RDL44361.1 hypothetical protein DN730_08125 [Marinomonas piezotolerans]
MATTTVVSIIKRAQLALNDKTSIVWNERELLDNFNDAVKDIVSRRPDANAINAFLDCTPDSSKQTLPANALRLVDVVRNKDGRVIQETDRLTLDSSRPDWHQSTPTLSVEHYIYDERDPKTFYLYPRPMNNGADPHQIEVVYSTCPEAIDIDDTAIKAGTDTTKIPLDDIYANPLLDFILYRCYSKDLGSAANAQRAASHYQAYGNALNVKLQADAMIATKG